MGYDCRFRQIIVIKPDVTWAQIDINLWNLAFSHKARVSDAISASVLRISQQNASGHQTKGLIPHVPSTSKKLQLNQLPPTLPHHDNTELVCSTTMSQLPAVHSLTGILNIFVVFVLMIHVPLIRASGLSCFHATLPVTQQQDI